MITSLTGWWLHVKILQQRRLFGAFIFFWRLFILCNSWSISPLGRNKAVCHILSWNFLFSRELAIQVHVFKGYTFPVTHGLGRGNVCGLWGFLSTTKTETQVKIPVTNFNNSFLRTANTWIKRSDITVCHIDLSMFVVSVIFTEMVWKSMSYFKCRNDGVFFLILIFQLELTFSVILYDGNLHNGKLAMVFRLWNKFLGCKHGKGVNTTVL